MYLYTAGKDAPPKDELEEELICEVLEEYLGELDFAMGVF